MKYIFEIPKDKNNKGYTLIEVLFALFIFSISMLGLGSLQLNSMQSVTKAGTITKAAALAHSQLELLKNVPMNDVKVLQTDFPIEANDCFWTRKTVTDDYPIAARVVDPASGIPVTVCKTIGITVFEDSAGSKILASASFIKSYTAIE